MKRLIIVFVVLFCARPSQAGDKDSVVQYRVIEAALSENSNKMDDNKYYEYLPIRMSLGDIALLRYESKDYVVALGVKDSAGHSGLKEDNPMMFSSLGSSITFPFKAPATGPYYFIFLSKEPEKKGKFKVQLYYYNRNNDNISNSTPFCDKLKYVTGMAYTEFEFLKWNEKKSFLGKKYAATVALLPEATNEISENISTSYRCVFDPTPDLDGMKAKYDALETDIAGCLTDFVKTEYTAETVAKFEKNDFIRQVRFEQKGTRDDDLNNIHGLSGIQSRVTLKLEKSGADKCELLLLVE